VRKRRFPVVGDGGGVSSFIHLDDAAAATVLALEHDGPCIYNIVDDEPAPTRMVAGSRQRAWPTADPVLPRLDHPVGSCMGAPPIPFCAMGGTPIHGWPAAEPARVVARAGLRFTGTCGSRYGDPGDLAAMTDHVSRAT